MKPLEITGKFRWHSRYFPALFSVMLCAGCVLPPSESGSRLIDQGELRVVSLVSQGKQYAQGGRIDIAEGYYRQALELEPNSSNIRNDLGYVLAADRRYEEARGMFERAVALDPSSTAARDNLARLHYQTGSYVDAAREYQELADLYVELRVRRGAAGIPAGFQNELTGAYRNLALLYGFLGLWGESFCYAELALQQGSPGYTISEHARYLLSLERGDLASKALEGVIDLEKVDLAPELLFDLGLSYAAADRWTDARKVFQRIPALSETTPQDRGKARALRALTLSKLGAKDELNELIDAAKDDKNLPCAIEEMGDVSYWPPNLKEDLNILLGELCRDSSTTLFKFPTLSF